MENKLIFIFMIFIFFSCKKPLKTIDENKINPSEKSTLTTFGYFNNENDVYLDTLNFYLDQINYLECESIRSELKKVYLRDQQYRDSVHSPMNINAETKRYFHRKMKLADRINEKIVWQILNKTGWTNTCEIDNQSNMGVWLTIYHSNNIEFKLNTLEYVKKAFEDSILTPEFYAYLIDNIYVKSGKKQIYGTYPNFGKYEDGNFPYHTSIGIDSVNFERALIGLEIIQ